jgi:hypothetical protein
MSLFFVAYASVKEKGFVSVVAAVLTLTVLGVSIYGIGQKYLGFPAYLTMNEEVAKGIALTLSPLGRVSSTFGGHYDLAAYLVLVLPIIVSLIFGYKNWILKGVLSVCVALGVFVLVMTVSRISVFGLIVALGLVVLFQRKKIVLYAIPIAVVAAVVFVSVSPSIIQRFGQTLTEIDILVDAKTGNPVGHVEDVSKEYFADKTVKQQFAKNIQDTISAASTSAAMVIPYSLLPDKAVLLAEPVASTGEDLPSGTGYINLTMSPVTKKLDHFYYEPKVKAATSSASVYVINGPYIVKKALAYDLSFTTRFQGEWPNAIIAFKRNILLGSGYGSVSLAVDNSYLRMLAETGVLGTIAFIAVFLVGGLYLAHTLPLIESKPIRSFVLGLAAGVVGLSINALFIDVFEASKVAFSLWLLMGLSIGLLRLHKPVTPKLTTLALGIATSTYAIIAYLGITMVMFFSPVVTNYFVGDDFTWFRWAANSGNSLHSIVQYFTNAQGFFYRPGAKIYFQLMYQFFWLNPTVYHTVSLFLHFAVSVLVFFLAMKVFRNKLLSAMSAFLFMILSGFTEAIFWISATGFLFTSIFALLSLLSYIAWLEKKNAIYLVGACLGSVIAMMFHELGVVTPVLCLLYQWTLGDKEYDIRTTWNAFSTKIMFVTLPLYALVRYFSHSLGLNGDYSYNVLKFPVNAIGNTFGYALMTVLGPSAQPIYTALRHGLQTHLTLAVLITIGLCIAGYIGAGRLVRSLSVTDRRMILFSAGFAIIALAPFLGLGNLSPRYGYLASVGFVLCMVYAITKVYAFLAESGRDIAVMSMTVILGVFGLYQLVQIQQSQGDWHEAGMQVQRFIVALEGSYEDDWTTSPMEFHLVNVPIRHGDAWVFPVGLPDALWFVFRNPQEKIFMWPDVPSAFAAVTYNSKTQRVFDFSSDGTVTEVFKPAPSTQ